MRPTLLPSGLAQVPFVWPGVDGFYYLARTPPADPASVRDAWLAALDKAIERGGLFVTICHAFLTGVDAARVAALEAVIRRRATPASRSAPRRDRAPSAVCV